jgi:hypothetical protein
VLYGFRNLRREVDVRRLLLSGRFWQPLHDLVVWNGLARVYLSTTIFHGAELQRLPVLQQLMGWIVVGSTAAVAVLAGIAQTSSA